MIDLLEGDTIDDHAVRERAVIEVVAGQIVLTAPDESAECEAGTLVSLEPGERHQVRALADTRLLLILAPWPAPDRDGDDVKDARHTPRNATVPPVELQDK